MITNYSGFGKELNNILSLLTWNWLYISTLDGRFKMILLIHLVPQLGWVEWLGNALDSHSSTVVSSTQGPLFPELPSFFSKVLLLLSRRGKSELAGLLIFGFITGKAITYTMFYWLQKVKRQPKVKKWR